MQPKARAVDEQGRLLDQSQPTRFLAEAAPDGTTRLAVAVPAERLQAVHAAMVDLLQAPLGVLYVQLVDRQAGQQHEEPKRFVGVDLQPASVHEAIASAAGLVYGDGRHQLWVKGARGAQIILDELGMIWTYPDDPSFREALARLGVDEGDAPSIGEADYVRVELVAEADVQEAALIARLGLQELPGGYR